MSSREDTELFAAKPPEKELQSEAQTRILDVAFSSIEDAAYVFDRAGRFVYANPPLLRLLGVSLPEIVGKNFFDLNCPPQLAARLQTQIQKVFDTREVVRDETPFANVAGEIGFYEYIFTPAFDAERKIDFVAGSTRDVTSRRQAADERATLRESLKMPRCLRRGWMRELLTGSMPVKS